MPEQHELAYDGCKYKCYLKEIKVLLLRQKTPKVLSKQQKKGKKRPYYRVFCRNIDPKCKVAVHLPAIVRTEPVLPRYVPPPPVVKLAPRQTVKPSPAIPNRKQADKLLALAQGMTKQIEAKLHPPISEQRTTARRARIAQSMYEKGEQLQQIQDTLYALSDAIYQGMLPPILSQVKTKSQVEVLYNLARGAEKWQQRIGLPTHPDLAWYMEYFQEQGSARYKEALSEWEGALCPFHAMGLTSDAQVKEAVEALATLGTTKVTPEQQWQKTIKAMEMELIGRDIPGYFPTPTKVAQNMVAMADIQPGMEVLEPSAGKGNIADVIREMHPDAVISVIEWDQTLRDILTKKGYNLVGSNFLEQSPKLLYDRIIMNPPFEKFQDTDHVHRAYYLLRPGGRLVAIMGESTFFRDDKKAAIFRAWLDEVGGTDEKLPEGAFFSSDRPTGVSARVVVIDKDTGLAGYFRRRYKRRY